LKIYPPIISNSILLITLTEPASSLQLIDESGLIVFERTLINRTGATSIHLAASAKGIYIMKLIAKDKEACDKAIVN
jgi:hypothetical protein